MSALAVRKKGRPSMRSVSVVGRCRRSNDRMIHDGAGTLMNLLTGGILLMRDGGGSSFEPFGGRAETGLGTVGSLRASPPAA